MCKFHTLERLLVEDQVVGTGVLVYLVLKGLEDGLDVLKSQAEKPCDRVHSSKPLKIK